MLSLSVFEFDAQGIEIALIDGNPWFNASQVTKALGYANPSKALQDNVSVKYNRQLDLGRPLLQRLSCQKIPTEFPVSP